MKNFSLNESKLTDDGKYFLKTGLIFRAGNYEDKNFSMTPEELIEAEASFSPVDIDVEHVDNLGILNGKLGRLEAVYASEDGEELYGTAKIPVWLNDLNESDDKSLKVSCTWDREEKKLKKLAIVKNPRVSDAALMAAFAKNEIDETPEKTESAVTNLLAWFVDNGSKAEFKDQTYEGKWAMQEVHDSMARRGAICTKPPKDSKAKMSVDDKDKANFVSKEESAAIQKMHDLALEAGAKCSFYEEDSYADYSNTKDDDTSSSETKFGRNKDMAKNWKSFVEFFKSLSEEEVEKLNSEFSGEEVDPEKAALQAQVKELTAKVEQLSSKEEFSKEEEKAPVVEDAEKEALKKQIAELTRKTIVADATAFAEELVKESKITPASREAVIALFTQAVDDDAATTPTKVEFSNDNVCTTRTEVLKAFFNSLEVHELTAEKLGAKKVAVLSFSKGEPAAETDIADARNRAKEYASKRNKVTAKESK